MPENNLPEEVKARIRHEARQEYDKAFLLYEPYIIGATAEATRAQGLRAALNKIYERVGDPIDWCSDAIDVRNIIRKALNEYNKH